MSSAEENAYEILGLPQGPAATDNEIKKAYRKLALIKHPDKNPNNPNAASEFASLQRAYDLLTDEEGRKALDDFLKARAARAERTVIHDKKRARMAEELKRREHAAENVSQEAKAKARLQAEIARMRQTAMEKEAKQRQAAAATGKKEREEEQHDGTAAAAVSAEVADALPRTLKVSWTRPGIEYTSADLRRIFSVHGEVEDIVLREAKKRKGSALVVMATKEAAEKAAQNVHGELSNPLLVIPLTKGSSSGQTNGTSSTQAVRTLVPTHIEVPNTAPSMPSSRPGLGPRPAAPLFPAGVKTSTAGGGTGSSRASFPQFASFSSFQPTSNAASTAAAPAVQVPSFQEDKDDPAVVRRRQAEERQRMIAQLQQEEDDD